MGFPPKRALQNFNFLRQILEIYTVSKPKEKIKFDKVWKYQNEGSPSNGPNKIQTFFTTHARHTKSSG